MADDPKPEPERQVGQTPLLAPPARRNNPNAWLLTFTDLVALLLTFFVMLFSMSAVKTGEWQSLVDSLRERLSGVIEKPVATPTFRLDMPSKDARPGADLDYVTEVLRAQLADSPALDRSVVRRASDRVVVSFPADMLFASGDFRLTDTARQAIFALGGVLRNFNNRIEVAGHADPRQPQRLYPSNWELSLLRAQSVAAGLRESGLDLAIVARGYGDGQYGQLPGDLAQRTRQALARRVDVVIGQTARRQP